MTKISDVINELKKHNSFLIFSHNRPDGDTIGSAIGLKLILESIGKKADLVCADNIPREFSYLPYWDKYMKGDEVKEKYDCHVAVDIASETVFQSLFGLFASNENTLCIDHHISNQMFAKVSFVLDNASNCENIFLVAKELGVEFTEEISLAIMTGIITDTNSFSNSNTTSNTLEIASFLFPRGGNIHFITQNIDKNQSRARSKLFLRVMGRMMFFLDNRFAVIYIDLKDLEETKALSSDTVGFIDYPMSISGVEVAISILEEKRNCYKISLRSRGKVDVNEIAKKYGGGGHVLAAGAKLKGSRESVLDKILSDVEREF